MSMRYSRLIRMGAIALFAVIAGGYTLLLVGVWGFQDQLLFGRRSSDITQTPSARQWPFEEVWADVNGEKTQGWWIPVEQARGVVLFSHGSGRNISGYLDDAAIFRELGYSVLLYDYGGYGRSSGKPSEARCYADIRAMWDHLVHVRHIKPECIVLAGASMGGGVTADLAATIKPGAVILEATFTSIPDAIADAYWWIPIRLLSHLQFRNIDKAPRIQSPVMVIHSKDDAVVPFAQGQQLYDAIKTPKTFLEIHGSHGGGKFASKNIYIPRLQSFLSEYCACPET